MCFLLSGLCPQMGLAGGFDNSVCDFERCSTAPKPCLTFLPKCKLFSQLLMLLNKENATFKGSTRCFQKHLRCKKGQASFSLVPADPE